MKWMDETSPTQKLVQWVVDSQWADVDLNTQTSVASSWMNWLACALGGANSPESDQLIRALAPFAQGDAQLIGRAEKLDPANAALIHAFTSNILDYDDTHWPTGIHPAGTVASALVAWASQTVVSGEDFLHAFLLGMEVECRIGLAVSPGHYERGWHITATCGVFGAAIAVGRLMRLNPQQMAWAVGHAATQSSGLVASLGTMAKSLNIAHAARNGVLSAQLARHGMTANDRILEARFGFNEVMGTRPLDESLCAGLGQNWIASHNTYKPYPCGFLLHPTLDACFAIDNATTFALDDIERIIVTVHPLSQIRADRIHPVDGLESKLSLQHAVAIALLRGEAGVRNFTDEAAKDLVVHACREKIKVKAEEGLSKDEARVVIHLQNGREIIREISEAQPPMSQQALEQKFRELVAFGSPHCNADELLETLVMFPQMTNVANLITMTVSQP
jgi:2-methylcitrate dehydratase PrpD